MEPDEIEMAKLYWEEFKYRHEHYWKYYFKFSYAIIFLLVIPYLDPDRIIQMGSYVYLLPVAAALLTIAAAWLLAAEYERMSLVNEKLQGIKSEKYKLIEIERTCIKKVLGIKIGYVVTIIFLVVFLLLSFLDWIILSNWTTQLETIR